MELNANDKNTKLQHNHNAFNIDNNSGTATATNQASNVQVLSQRFQQQQQACCC
jgi:hypothetical protein